MNQNLAQQAIDKALLGEWKEAKDVNLSILKQNPQDTDALNRLAKCYFELGNIKTAKSTIAKILKIDSYNPIALKSFEKWKNLKKIDKNTSKHLSPEKFLEEPGKTKIIHLIHPCDDSLLAKLNCGDIVYGNANSHRVSIMSESGKYIGKIPDDISIKIKKLMKLGYEYIFAIKSIDKNEIKIFIREANRPETGAAAAEDLRGREEVRVNLEPDDRFVLVDTTPTEEALEQPQVNVEENISAEASSE